MAPQYLSTLDPSTLRAFENAAAGHNGVLSDESGALFIKPSTQQESDFYQTVFAHHPDLRGCMPTFMGTLNLSTNGNVETTSPAPEMATDSTSNQVAPQSHGRRIESDTAIVLENFENSFRRANVIDLKLGAQLCAPGTKPEKAERLNKAALETTTASLGFRITGMKVWNGTSFDIFDKMYGRKFSADDVIDGFATFFAPMINGLESEFALHVIKSIRDEITRIRTVLENCETRMFSASLLLNYEGDIQALRGTMEAVSDTVVDEGSGKSKLENNDTGSSEVIDDGAVQADTNNIGELDNSKEQDEDGDDDEEEEKGSTPFKMGLVDFAHASFAPGEGNDQNVIQGLKSIEAQLALLIKRVE